MSLREDQRVSVDGSVEYLPGTEPGILHGRHPARTGHGPSPLEHKIEYDAERNNRDSFEESTYYESEDGHDIKYKTLTWKKVFLLGKKGKLTPRPLRYCSVSIYGMFPRQHLRWA
jgi:hypothetical protein